ncbi:restriction endonuclease subunit S [Acinetobacter sp. 161(2023)]|uniref:restriction endonuclease subunit S n=1 Tax=Acinetobacter sp. 161(2023) TaxID=3098768 RepID=UPI00300959A5
MEKQKSPEIRFQQFNDTWTETSLGNLSQIRRGASPRPIEDPKWFDKSGLFGWLRIADVTQQNGRIFSIEQKLSVQGQQKTLILEEPHLILSIAATVGKPVINYVPTGIHDGFIVFLNLNADREFIFQWLERFRPNWFKLGQPGSQLNLNSELVKNQSIFLSPLMEEQTQIGNFFQNLDQSIALHEKKLAQTQNLKKAMLEKMFPKAGSKQPEIRLKGFDGDWNGLIISDLIEGGIIDKPMDGNHGELHPTSADYIKSGVAFVMANDISNGQLNLKKCKNISYKLSKTLQKGFAVENDVLLTHKATIGETAIVPKLNTPYLVLTPQVTYYRVLNSLKLSNFFLQYSFQASYFKKAMSLAVTGATRLYIGITEQQQLPFLITSFKEQEAIGQFFRQLDETLVLQHQQLQTLKNLKQAFLEKMFV